MGIDILIIVLLLAIDQIVKYLTVLYLKGQGPKILIDGVFHLQYVENRGAAWGKFQNHTIFLVLITTIVLVFIIYNYFKIPRTKKYLPLRMTILLFMAGAIGNYIDRIRLNYVIDTFYVKLIDFPVFNVADCYIVVGSIILLILLLFIYKSDDLEFSKIEREK